MRHSFARIVVLSALLLAVPLVAACRDEKAGGPDPLQAVGRIWVAEDIDNRGVIDNSRSMIVFAANGRLRGHTGCNNLMGEVSLGRGTITLPATPATTRMACTAEAMADQERRFIEALPRAARWDVKDGLLHIYDEDNKPLLRFHEDRGEADGGAGEGPAPQ